MRKLTLNVDDLRVDSFAVDPHAPPRDGTVRGHVFNNDTTIVTTDDDIPWYETWWYGCQAGPSQGTCPGPTYCCAATWQQTCPQTCHTCPQTCMDCDSNYSCPI